MTSNQRWLSLTGICTCLEIVESHALWLAKQGHLQVIWGKGGHKNKDARFLEPTAEYANKLKLGEALYGRIFPIPRDLDLNGLFTLREVAEILGWSWSYAQTYVHQNKVPRIKVGKYGFYSIKTVREMMWKRQGRKQAVSRPHILVEDLIRFFLAHKAETDKEVPTDVQYASDDLLQRQFSKLAKLPSPAKEEAMLELWGKIELAKSVAGALATDTALRESAAPLSARHSHSE